MSRKSQPSKSTPALGVFLKTARETKGLSQSEVATRLGLRSAQSVSDWERSYGCVVPVYALKELIRLYGLPVQKTYGLFEELHLERVRTKLEGEFFGAKKRSAK